MGYNDYEEHKLIPDEKPAEEPVEKVRMPPIKSASMSVTKLTHLRSHAHVEDWCSFVRLHGDI